MLGDGYYKVTDKSGDENLYTEEDIMGQEDLLLLLDWCRQISCGLDFLCKKGIVHVDMAARNVLLTKNKQVKICDFGLSRKCLNEQSAAASLVSVSAVDQ